MPIFEVLGLHFGISKAEAKDTFHYWLEIFQKDVRIEVVGY